MRKAATKSLYLFLCAILGMVLFAMLHRAIFVLYDLLIFIRPEFTFGLTSYSLAVGDFLTMLIALFLGGWYGTMMGIDWYAMVYGPNAAVRPGLFHGFIPHHWRGRRESRSEKGSHKSAPVKMAMPAPATKTTTVKVRMPDPEPEEEMPSAPRVREWTFEDLMPPKPAPKKRAAAKKTTARKTVRKTAVKKVAKTE